jgi:hypothetical protein
VNTWTINDTNNFAISSAGIVSNILVLVPGVYALSVSVIDVMGSEITGEFTVTVEAPLISPIPIELILIIAVIVIVIIVLLLLLYYFVLRKRK